MLGIVRYAPGQYVTEVRANNLHDIDPQHFSCGVKEDPIPTSFRGGMWGRAILPATGLPAGWTRWKAGPQAVKPAPPFRRMLVILHAALH